MKKEPETKRRGRPRKYETDAERQQASRRKQGQDNSRIDAYINASASWRLTGLSKAWECSKGRVIERLLIEADEKYEKDLSPVTE